MSKILITGATGGVGKLILSQLLSHTPPPPLRVSSRDPSKVKVPPTVEVVKGDLSDPSSFPTLFNGVGKAFLYVQGTDKTAKQLVQAAKDAGVRHIVLLSSAAVLSPNNNFIKQMHTNVEDAIKESGLTYTFLRAGAFNTNTLKMWAPQIKYKNKITLAFLNSHSAPIADEDTALVGSIALTSSQLDNAAPVLTGPRSLTQEEQVQAISKVREEVKGEKVEYEGVTGEQWKELVKGKFPDEVVEAMLKMWPTTDGIPQPVSPEFEKITGKKGTEFIDWVRLHKDEFFS